MLERNFVFIPPKGAKKDGDVRNSTNSQVEVEVEVEIGDDGTAHVSTDSVEEEVTGESAEEGGIAIIEYHSVEDARIPMHPDRIRAECPLTLWRFQDVTNRERGNS